VKQVGDISVVGSRYTYPLVPVKTYLNIWLRSSMGRKLRKDFDEAGDLDKRLMGIHSGGLAGPITYYNDWP
jgi:hypothetical protein